MPQIAAVSIADGETTPVSHVFNPIATNPKPQWRRNGVSVPAVGMERLEADTKLATTANGVHKHVMSLVIPVMEQTAGGTAQGYVAPPGVAHELKGVINLFNHQRSTKQDRKNLRIMLANWLLSAAAASQIDDLEKPF